MQIKTSKLRYFIKLAYNGKDYFGWQIQPRQKSVQQTVEESISTILRQEIKLVGAGRTDTGVHSKIMFAHFDFDKTLPKDLAHRMNQFLPKDIVIYEILKVKDGAHARFDALSRTYHYLIRIGKDPFDYDYSWQIHQPLNIEKMNLAAEFLLGKQDFSSFAKIHTDVKTHICEVKSAFWTVSDNQLRFEITADRFLRNMVRSIVGTLVDAGREKISLAEFKTIIEKRDRKFASGSAPAQGLYLVGVEYPKSIYTNE